MERSPALLCRPYFNTVPPVSITTTFLHANALIIQGPAWTLSHPVTATLYLRWTLWEKATVVAMEIHWLSFFRRVIWRDSCKVIHYNLWWNFSSCRICLLINEVDKCGNCICWARPDFWRLTGDVCYYWPEPLASGPSFPTAAMSQPVFQCVNLLIPSCHIVHYFQCLNLSFALHTKYGTYYPRSPLYLTTLFDGFRLINQ